MIAITGLFCASFQPSCRARPLARPRASPMAPGHQQRSRLSRQAWSAFHFNVRSKAHYLSGSGQGVPLQLSVGQGAALPLHSNNHCSCACGALYISEVHASIRLQVGAVKTFWRRFGTNVEDHHAHEEGAPHLNPPGAHVMAAAVLSGRTTQRIPSCQWFEPCLRFLPYGFFHHGIRA
jgi:hypothetical protein